jgi:PAS domain S-box-containing protein
MNRSYSNRGDVSLDGVAGDEEEDAILLALVRENAKLRHQVQILDSVQDFIVAFDLEGRILFASQSILRFLGLRRAEDIEGKSFWELLKYESRVLVQKELEDAIAQKIPGEDPQPIANGRTLMVCIVVKENGMEENYLVSLKGMLHVEDHDPQCICSMRLAADVFQLNHVDSSAVISVNGESEGE